jgi:hypothetical protein
MRYGKAFIIMDVALLGGFAPCGSGRRLYDLTVSAIFGALQWICGKLREIL